MNTLRTLYVGVVPLLSTGAALAQSSNMMGGTWGGWMGGYGGIWIPSLIVAVIVAVIVMLFRR